MRLFVSFVIAGLISTLSNAQSIQLTSGIMIYENSRGTCGISGRSVLFNQTVQVAGNTWKIGRVDEFSSEPQLAAGQLILKLTLSELGDPTKAGIALLLVLAEPSGVSVIRSKLFTGRRAYVTLDGNCVGNYSGPTPVLVKDIKLSIQ
ncbi:MAG: hypothetical protein C5B49_09700 [Bdellovibrio sp.]|nr:MAG: hypothetical protein C5B49_09700 [Bdellovibrio sp.]